MEKTNTYNSSVRIEIDQSWKIENTQKETILAFSNHLEFVIKVPAEVKRRLRLEFKKLGKPRLFVYRSFSAAIFLLIKDYLKQVTEVIIDTEYPGREELIKDILLEFIRRFHLPEPEIRFWTIGKKAKVHTVAYDAFRGERAVDKEVSFDEIAPLAIKHTSV